MHCHVAGNSLNDESIYVHSKLYYRKLQREVLCRKKRIPPAAVILVTQDNFLSFIEYFFIEQGTLSEAGKILILNLAGTIHIIAGMIVKFYFAVKRLNGAFQIEVVMVATDRNI